MTQADLLHKLRTNTNVTYITEYHTEDFSSVSGWLNNKYFRVYFDTDGHINISSATEEIETFKNTFGL